MAMDKGTAWSSSRRRGKRALTGAREDQGSDLPVDTMDQKKKVNCENKEGQEVVRKSPNSSDTDEVDQHEAAIASRVLIEEETESYKSYDVSRSAKQVMEGIETEEEIALLEARSGVESDGNEVEKEEEEEDRQSHDSMSSSSLSDSIKTVRSSTEALRTDTLGQSSSSGKTPIGWIPCQTEDGLTYFYNQRTHESEWTIPASPRVTTTYTKDHLFHLVSLTDKELESEDFNQLDTMLQAGVELDAFNFDGLTALHVACLTGKEQIAALLLSHGAKVDVRALGDQTTPLMLACRTQRQSMATLLLESNASLSACDCNGNTALHAAVSTGNEALVVCILRGCDPTHLCLKNNQGETALHIAAKLGSLETIRWLLAYGANSTDEDAQGRTPLVRSLLENHVESVQLLQSIESNTRSTKPVIEVVPAEQDALTVLTSYLEQVLPHHFGSKAHTEHPLIEQVRAQMNALDVKLQASEARYRAQVQKLSADMIASAHELEKERRLHAETRRMHQVEQDVSCISYQALVKRCEFLESITRNTHLKLERERREHIRYEENLQHKLQQSLQESANLMESCRQIQANWHDRPQSSIYLKSCDYEEVFHDVPEVESRFPDLARNDQNASQTSVSSQRVGAVWNHFFDNVGHLQGSNGSLDGDKHLSGASFSSSFAFDAVRKSDLPKLKAFLLHGMSPNQRDGSEKGTLLHLACELGDLEIVRLLSEFAADFEALDEAANSPLLVACLQGQFACVEFLLQSAVSLDAVNENNDSALHLAAWDGHVSCVKILLEYGSDPMALNRFGLTARSNIKTRSSLRHTLKELPKDHAMRQTLVVLEEAEGQHLHKQMLQDRLDNKEHEARSKLENTENQASSWMQWLFSFRLRPSEASSHTVNEKEQHYHATRATHDDDIDGDEMNHLASCQLDETKYEPLIPPPEIEEAVRRAKADQVGTWERQSPKYSIARTDSSKRNPVKPRLSSPRSTVRSRYVDTFNTSLQ